MYGTVSLIASGDTKPTRRTGGGNLSRRASAPAAAVLSDLRHRRSRRAGRRRKRQRNPPERPQRRQHGVSRSSKDTLHLHPASSNCGTTRALAASPLRPTSTGAPIRMARPPVSMVGLHGDNRAGSDRVRSSSMVPASGSSGCGGAAALDQERARSSQPVGLRECRDRRRELARRARRCRQPARHRARACAPCAPRCPCRPATRARRSVAPSAAVPSSRIRRRPVRDPARARQRLPRRRCAAPYRRWRADQAWRRRFRARLRLRAPHARCRRP